MTTFYDRAKMSTATTGTGTITLGSATAGFQSFADAGVQDAETVSYGIEDGNNWETGTGTYTASGTTLTRTVGESSNSDAAIDLSGTAVVWLNVSAADLNTLRSDIDTAQSEVDQVEADLITLVGDQDKGDITISGSGATWTIGAGVVTFAKMATAAIASASEFLSNTASKILTAAGVWGAAAFTTLTDATSIAVDLDTGINFKVTLTDDRTLANPTNAKEGQTGTIRVIQDGSGGHTLAFGDEYSFAGGTPPTLTTTASAYDLLFYQVLDNGDIFVTAQLDVQVEP